jgi:diguanylate cyclase (GGDEF)-like protein/PAS domain S-box-containing protein/putative nucleotidyltransferase with HDIG domain
MGDFMKDIYKSKKRLIKELEDTRRLLSQKATKELKTDVARKEAGPYREVVENRRDKEALLLIRKAIDSATDAIGLSDSEGHHIYQNKAFTDLFEYTAEELGAAGGGPAAFAVKSTAREVFGSIMSGRSWSGEVEMRAKSGRIFSLFLRADAIKDDAGKIVGLVGVFTDITERKRLEYQLRKKHDELQLILDSIPAYVFYKDKDGKMLNINKAATALVYVPKEKLLQKTVFDLIPETADKYNRDDMEVIRSGQPKINIEESLELPSGVRWLKTDKIPIKDDDGNIVGLLGFSVDITDLRKAQEELLLIRKAVQSSSDAIGMSDPQGHHFYQNESYGELFGYEVDELNALGGAPVIFKDYKIALDIFDLAMRGGQWNGEVEMASKDGRNFPVFLRVNSIKDEAGKIIGVIGTHTDITERRKAEQALRESEAKYRFLTEKMNDIVWTADMNFNSTYVSPSIARILGYTLEERLVQPAKDQMTPESFERAVMALAAELEQDGREGVDPDRRVTLEVEYYHKNGSIVWTENVVSAIRDDKGRPIGLHGVSRDITERKKAEQALRESEERYRLLAENVSDVIWIMDLDLKYLYVSPSIERMRGFTPEEFVGMTAWDYVSKESLAVAAKRLAAELELEKIGGADPDRVTTMELEVKRKDGSWMWTEAKITFMRDNEGKPIGLLGVTRDISERKRVEEALREASEKLQVIFDSMGEAATVVDLGGNIVDANKEALRLHGFGSKDEIIGRKASEMVAFVDRDRAVNDAIKALKSSYLSGRTEYKLIDAGGREFDGEFNVAVIKDNKGKPAGFIGIARDITERRKMEEALKKSEEYFKEITENSSDMVIITDKNADIKYCSRSIERFAGYKSEELIGKSGFAFIHPDDVQRAVSAFGKAILTKEAVSNAFRIVHKDGTERFFDGLGKNLLDNPSVAGFIMNVRDVTERRKMEEALRESEERYRLLAENATDVIWTVNMDMVLTYVSPSITRLLGYTVEEALARPMSEAYTPSSFAATMQAATEEIAIEQIGQGDPKRSRILELELYRKDGSVVPVEANFSFLRDAAGKPIGILAMVRDITERKRAEEDVKRHAKRIEALYGIAQVISQSSTLDTMLKDALEKVCTAMDTESGCIFMLDFDESALKLKSYRGISESIVSQFLTIVMTEQGIEGLMKLTGPITEIDETQDVMEPEKMKKVTADIGRRGIAAVPFFRGKDLQGLIVTFTTEDRTFSSEDLELLKAIANEISIGINNMLLLEKTREMSVTDELTGLYNRRHFFETLDVEMNRARRTNHPFSLVMLDLDGFKEYNDKYGHSNGDAVLQTVSQMLKSSIRKSDLAFRYGGDEFALILPAAAAERAKKIVQRARAKWQKAPLTQSKIFGGHVGFSTGIAEYPENAESADGLIFLADAALYQAKKKGYEDKLVSELRTLSTDIMDVATQDQVYALAATVDARDPYTYGHSQRVADIAMAIGKAIGMSAEDLTKLHAAALLHDIGKVGVPDSILAKIEKPTPEEWDVIKKHCAEGARIVSYVKELSTLVPIILHHHEWYDGSGYPGGLKGIDIPSGARITSVADAYDTMVTKRPYRDVISPKKACEELKRNAGVQFDPVIVDAWCRLMDKAGKEDK